MLKIYFKNRILSICSKGEVPAIADSRFLMRPEPDYDFTKIPFLMESNPSFKYLAIETPDGMPQEKLLEAICSKVRKIYAAGGLVSDKDGNYLMIYRNGVWDLPKGKQEEGEDIAVTALREVKEESGVDASKGPLLTITYHTYWLDGELVVKSTRWYRMFADSKYTCPQEEEGIQKCEWVTPDDLDYRLANTYPSVADVFNAALKK